MSKVLVNDARTIWNILRGVICVYKPADVSCNQVRKTIVSNICKELCELNCRPPTQYVSIEGDPTKKLTVTVSDSYADHPLVIGPRYQPKDVRCTWSSFLSRDTSGVLCNTFHNKSTATRQKGVSAKNLKIRLLWNMNSVNDGTKTVQKLCEAKPLRTYKITGKLGEATDNYYKNGHIVEKSTFKYVKRHNVDRLLSTMQAVHQKKMFELCGVDIQSQAAYELAVQGLVRPTNSQIPLLYGIKCVHFDSPHFTIEVQCVNEYALYLKTLIHEIGMQLHTTAHCTGIQCVRHSYFNLEDALLKKHWNLQNVVDNLTKCGNILNEHRDLLMKKSAVLQ